MHLVATLPSTLNDQHISEQANTLGIRVPALSKHYLNNKKQQGLLIGFAGTPCNNIISACQQLGPLCS
jgi:DNA-binding transcriptional MocR family regulator